MVPDFSLPTSVPVDYREDWGALPAKANPGPFRGYEASVCHYTAGNLGFMVPEGAPHERCRAQVRAIQVQHQNVGNQTDISYNALACSHGYLLEGRIEGYKGGANGSAASNAVMPSVCCLVGVGDVPSEKMLTAVRAFHLRVEALSEMGWLEMKPHQAITQTSCPGDWLEKWLEDDHYHDGQDDPPAPDPVPPPPPNTGEDVMHFIGAYQNAQWVIAGDLSSRTVIASEKDLQALLASGRFVVLTFTDEQMDVIPEVMA